MRMESAKKSPTITDWHGCYEGGWQGMIAAEAFAHPAKFSYALICKIVRHGLDQGYWKPGDTIGDPFGGVATGGIVCGYHGLNWVGCELEPRFVELGNKNLDIHRQSWRALKQPVCARLLQGDSRRFEEVLAFADKLDQARVFVRKINGEIDGEGTQRVQERIETRGHKHSVDEDATGTDGAMPTAGEGIAGIITSPPYADTTNVGEYRDPEKCKAREERYLAAHPELVGKRPAFLPYGSSEGQIGSLKAGDLDAVITSPPFLDARSDTTKSTPTRHGGDCADRHDTTQSGHGYGDSAGQIGALKSGSLDGVVTSPPHAESLSLDRPNAEERRKLARELGESNCENVSPIDMEKIGKRHEGDYGTTPGQIGALKAVPLDGVVTSPPWENQEPSHAQGSKFEAKHRELHPTKLAKDRPSVFQHEYGKSDGQIGKSAGETYWQAMHAVYGSMHAAMKPGGIAAIVVKDYVKAKARVPLCDQTCTLLESLGFEVFERCRCWLVKERREPSLFGGEHVTKTERKSFFRRLAEKKGSPRIDWEEVIWCRRVN